MLWVYIEKFKSVSNMDFIEGRASCWSVKLFLKISKCGRGCCGGGHKELKEAASKSDGWMKKKVMKGVKAARMGSICLLLLPIGTAVFQTVTDADSLRWERQSDNSFGFLLLLCLFFFLVSCSSQHLSLKPWKASHPSPTLLFKGEFLCCFFFFLSCKNGHLH